MNPLSLLTNLAINEVVKKEHIEAPEDSAHARISVQLLVTDANLGKAIKNCLSDFQFPFERICLKSISVLNQGLSSFDIIPILKNNLEEQVHTIVIGSEVNTLKASFDALQFREKYFNSSIVLSSAGQGVDRVIFEVKRPWLQNLNLLGNQAHLSDHKYLIAGESEGLRSIRLGTIRSEPGCVEPEIRSSDLFGISLNALKHSDSPIQSSIASTGLTSEEACQLLYYAGRSDRNKITTIYDFLPSATRHPLGINLLSTLVWYYLHGLNYRSHSPSQKLELMKKFSIDDPVQGHHLTFYKDEKEQKWWLESPFKDRILTREMPLVACDYLDYRSAANDQLLSERVENWFHLYENSDLLDQSL
ncbi:MAG: hypothetical protein KDC80_17940 [Saprospiraceae bacterium]|nr:hypothetical protein [Saprospiraceae bacterium]